MTTPLGKDDLVKTLKQLKTHGPFFGYHVTNRHLITKSDFIPKAMNKFKNLEVEVVNGHRVLGSVIGSSGCCEKSLYEISREHNELSAAGVDLKSEELYSLDLAAEKVSSCWLIALSIKQYQFNLTKSEFRDGIALI